MSRLKSLGLCLLVSTFVYAEPPVVNMDVSAPSAQALLSESSVGIDTSKLQEHIKSEKLAKLRKKIDKSKAVAPKSIEGDVVIARLNFGLDKLDDALVKSHDDKDIIATDSASVPLSQILLLPGNRYHVVGKKKNEPETLPADDGRYAYHVLSKHKAELILVPEKGKQKGTAFKVVLDFTHNKNGTIDTSFFKKLKGSVSLPVDFKKLMYVTDQKGMFELKPDDHD